MNRRSAIALIAPALLGVLLVTSRAQQRTAPPPDENALREYCGNYAWENGGYIYFQLWSEFTGKNQLVAFDESGEVRALYSTDHDRFLNGPAVAVSTPVESRIDFQRDRSGRIASLIWRREGAAPRLARRVDIEKREDVRFSNGEIQLAGTLIRPNTRGPHPAIILVHASGAEDREYLVPFAHFLVRRGIALLGYDKRGVGGSTGDWRNASFDDLAGDVVAAFEYLRTRKDIDRAHIGLLGWSQAGWVMPLAANHAKNIAFLISVSGAGVPAAETTIDETRNEMTARGMKPDTIEQIVELMRLQYEFAKKRQSWDDYITAREKLIAKLGRPPDTFPATRDDPLWDFIRRLYFYDPAPTLRQLRLPILALFGELDDNVIAEKNKAAWESALKASGNSDYTLRILPKANHMMLEAKVGSNSEMPTLQRFVPAYSAIVREWLATQIRLSGIRKRV